MLRIRFPNECINTFNKRLIIAQTLRNTISATGEFAINFDEFTGNQFVLIDWSLQQTWFFSFVRDKLDSQTRDRDLVILQIKGMNAEEENIVRDLDILRIGIVLDEVQAVSPREVTRVSSESEIGYVLPA